MAGIETLSKDGPTLAEVIDVQVSGPNLDLTLFVQTNLVYFEGHFPEFPILPGVVQIAWVVNFAKEYFGITAAVRLMERLKFTRPIRPGMRVNVKIDIDQQKQHINFRYYDREFTFSQGRLVYDD